jgi:sortase A
MKGMSESSPLRRGLRTALVVGAAITVAAAGGIMAGQATDGGRVATAAPPAKAEAPAVDLTPVGAAVASVIEGLSADLPVPEPSPLDARAPTPKVQLGQLQIPSIGLDQPLFQGVTLTAIDNGPSHWPGSALPGELGNSVIAGHRTTKTRPFWDLDLVQPGDELIITMTTGERHVYTLDRIEIVDADALHIVDQTYGYRATLFGCHPKGSLRQRIVGHFTLQSTTPA